MLYFAYTPLSWGSSPDSADDALKQAKANFRDTFRANKTPHYVLAFPTGTRVEIGMLGGWSSDKLPVAVVIARNIDDDTRANLEGMVERAAAKSEASA